MHRPHCVALSLSGDTGAGQPATLNGDWSLVHLSSVPSFPFSEFSHPTLSGHSPLLSSLSDEPTEHAPAGTGKGAHPPVAGNAPNGPGERNGGGVASAGSPPANNCARRQASAGTSMGRRGTKPLEKTAMAQSLTNIPTRRELRDNREEFHNVHLPSLSDSSQPIETSAESLKLKMNNNPENETNTRHPSILRHGGRRRSVNGRDAKRRSVTTFSIADVVVDINDTPVDRPPQQVQELSPQNMQTTSNCSSLSRMNELEGQFLPPLETAVPPTSLPPVAVVNAEKSIPNVNTDVIDSRSTTRQPRSIDSTPGETRQMPHQRTVPSSVGANYRCELTSHASFGGTKERSPEADPRRKQLKQSVSRERLTQSLKRVLEPEVLHLIREHISDNCHGIGVDTILHLCDTRLKELEENTPLDSAMTAEEGEVEKNGITFKEGEADEEDSNKCFPDDALNSTMEEDEFDDNNIKESVYPTVDPRTKYSFATPSVTGTTSMVFPSGMLYKIHTEGGEYFFFNDTLQYVMVVRVRCNLRGDEVMNEKVVQAPVGNGETELTLAILPEETVFFLKNIKKLPRILAKGAMPPSDFVAPSVKRNEHDTDACIKKVRAKLGSRSRAGDQKSFLKCCITHGIFFTDLEFRPSRLSLCRPGVDEGTLTPLTWRRPVEYLLLTEVSEARLFRNNISCQLVRQGILGDQTVIAGIAAVAMYPGHVRWMFRHPVSSLIGKSERAVGAYRVTLCSGGWWTTFLLDDYFPASLNAPLFARCPLDPRRLWVSFLEKAYAKALGSYMALCSADALEVLADFTGFPTRHMDDLWVAAAAAVATDTPAAANALYKYIHSCTRRHFIIMVYTPSPQRPSSASSIDISRRLSMRFSGSPDGMPLFLPGHVYFITEAIYYEDLDLRMVRLKNPWTCFATGKPRKPTKWKKSKWFEQSENSTSIVPCNSMMSQGTHQDGAVEGKNNVLKKKDFGTMWLEWSEALSTFEGGGVCYTYWSWHDYRIKNTFHQTIPNVVLEFRVKNKVEVIFSLLQESRLRNPGSAKTSGYDAMLLLVTRHKMATKMEMPAYMSCGDVETRSGKLTYHAARDISLKCILEPTFSPYYVIPRVYEPSNKVETPFVLSIFSDTKIGDDVAQVRFCHLDPSCEVFKDTSSFVVNPKVCLPTKATYQCRTSSSVSVCEGECIKP